MVTGRRASGDEEVSRPRRRRSRRPRHRPRPPAPRSRRRHRPRHRGTTLGCSCIQCDTRRHARRVARGYPFFFLSRSVVSTVGAFVVAVASAQTNGWSVVRGPGPSLTLAKETKSTDAGTRRSSRRPSCRRRAALPVDPPLAARIVVAAVMRAEVLLAVVEVAGEDQRRAVGRQAVGERDLTPVAASRQRRPGHGRRPGCGSWRTRRRARCMVWQHDVGHRTAVCRRSTGSRRCSPRRAPRRRCARRWRWPPTSRPRAGPGAHPSRAPGARRRCAAPAGTPGARPRRCR